MERRNQNSLVRAQMLELASSLFLDLQQHHPHLKSDLALSLRTLSRRAAAEGVGFFTRALPSISKALLRAIETNRFEPPKGFACRKGTVIPRFCGELLTLVMNDDGTVKSNADSVALADMVQLGSLFYKLDLPYSYASNKRVIDNFKEVEEQLSNLQLEELHDDVLDAAGNLVEAILHGFNPMDIIPRHGPGAVATGEKGQKKWDFKRKYKRLHEVYPYYSYLYPTRNSIFDRLRKYRELELVDSGCARVVLVPKDSRGPRLISMEPLEYQFVQQGLSKALVKHLEVKSSITSGSVNFTDQGVNRSLALYNSVSRSYATLDMKEASDRVSLTLVKRLFRKRPDVLKCLTATRTTHTELPDGEILPLSKFAPMGSALCFPVEALSFFALSECIRRREGIPGRVYVYGDDIIVPTQLAPVLFKELPTYGLKFNEDKCFIDGYFRESCGMDAYKGKVCTPVRMRRSLPTSRKDACGLVSGVELSNALWLRGYWNASTYVRNACESVQHVGVTRSPEVNFGGLSYVSFTTKGVMRDQTVKLRFDKGLQQYQVLSHTAKSVQKKRKNWDGYNRLFENLVGQTTTVDTVPHAVTTKLRWIPFYS